MTTILRLIKIYSEKMPQCIVLSWTFFAIISEGTFLQDFLLRVQQEFFQRFPRELFYNYIYFFQIFLFHRVFKNDFNKNVFIYFSKYTFRMHFYPCKYLFKNFSKDSSRLFFQEFLRKFSYGFLQEFRGISPGILSGVVQKSSSRIATQVLVCIPVCVFLIICEGTPPRIIRIPSRKIFVWNFSRKFSKTL